MSKFWNFKKEWFVNILQKFHLNSLVISIYSHCSSINRAIYSSWPQIIIIVCDILRVKFLLKTH